MSEWCKCGQLLRAQPSRHHPSCLVRITFEQGNKNSEHQRRQMKAAEALLAEEQKRTRAAEVAAEAATRQAKALERDRKQQQREREQQQRDEREQRAREDDAAEALRGWRSRLAQLTRLLDRDPERAWLDLRHLREDVDAEGLSARDFNPAEREAFSRFEVDVDAAAERLDQHHGRAIAAVRRWIELESQRAELEAAARADADVRGVLPSYEDAVQRREAAKRDRERIESLRFPPPEPGWSASTFPIEGGLEGVARAARTAWARLDGLPQSTSPGPEPTPPETPRPPEQPQPPQARWPTDREVTNLTVMCGALCALAGGNALWHCGTKHTVGSLATVELVLLFVSAVGAAALQLALRRRDALTVLDHTEHARLLEQHQRAMLLYEEEQQEYERQSAVYGREHTAYQLAVSRQQEIEANRSSCQGIIAQAAQRLRTAHREASQREDDASVIVLALTPLREFDNDPERGGFLAAMNERRRDLRDDIERLGR